MTLHPDTSLEIDRALAEKLPVTWAPFFGRFGRLREVQRKAIDPILAGRDVLVMAPTASGKTEAVCAPMVERNVREHARWMVVYISPTRALANDLFHRLSGPCRDISVTIAVRTADHPTDLRLQPNIVITTPESFDSWLCRGRDAEHGHVFANVTTMVLDEIHLLDVNARGEQLRWLIERLRRLRAFACREKFAPTSELQVIALSATVPSPEAVAQRYLSSDAQIISVAGQREIETVSVNSDLPTVESALPFYLGSDVDDRKILVFANTRKRVDELTNHLTSLVGPLGFEVHPHHGSLTKTVREATEDAARSGDRIVIVATSTLEIGIDIGAIDLVVLDGPPPDVPALLQRIGRGNRRTQRTRVMSCCGSIGEAFIHAAMLQAARTGDLGPDHAGPWYAAARQQVGSYVYQSNRRSRPRAAVEEFVISKAAPEVGASLIDHLITTGDLLHDSGELRLSAAWMEQFSRGQAHSNIEKTAGASVVDVSSGEVLMNGVRWGGGRGLRLGARILKVTSERGPRIEVREASDPRLADAVWGYVSGQWYQGPGQPAALRKYLGLKADEWPVIQTEKGYAVFHLGGARRATILRLLAPGSVQVDQWLLRLSSPVKPAWISMASVGTVLTVAANDIDGVERTLGRPYANRLLPLNARIAEIREWLRVSEEVSIFANSRWLAEVDNQKTIVLRAIANVPKRKRAER